MNVIKKNSRMLLVALAAVVIGFAGGAIAAQPHLYNAKAALENARAELNVAEHNKGGHRVRAVKLVNEAIREVNEGIRAGGG
jgi:cell division protein FtsN